MVAASECSKKGREKKTQRKAKKIDIYSVCSVR